MSTTIVGKYCVYLNRKRYAIIKLELCRYPVCDIVEVHIRDRKKKIYIDNFPGYSLCSPATLYSLCCNSWGQCRQITVNIAETTTWLRGLHVRGLLDRTYRKHGPCFAYKWPAYGGWNGERRGCYLGPHMYTGTHTRTHAYTCCGYLSLALLPSASLSRFFFDSYEFQFGSPWATLSGASCKFWAHWLHARRQEDCGPKSISHRHTHTRWERGLCLVALGRV